MSKVAPSSVKRALAEIKALRARVETAEGALHAPIAVVGLSVRLPGGVSDADALWALLRSGGDGIGEIPPDRWSVDELYSADPDAPGKISSRRGGFIDKVYEFDPQHFGIAGREAASMDPQQRLLLELAWEALENAGIAPDALRGSRAGVYVGLGNCDYARSVFSDPAAIDTYCATGTAYSIAAGRIAYTLGLTGPAVTVDTACSASLVAVHLATQALRLGECDAALVGGVNLILSPEMHISFTKGRMLATDGRCKTFDAEADGYVRGEGGVVVVLKRLADARAAGDRVLAVIRGSAINQDGRSSGITAPNGPAQEAVIRAALANACVDAAEVGYVEAHGTGTSLGDPIELGALRAVYGTAAGRRDPLLVGSLKTNIGHTEAAAGLAGLAKCVLALAHGVVPRSLHFTRGNPHFDWAHSGIAVAATDHAFPTSADGRCLAGVSSFGFSGTNAHVVLEQASQNAVPTSSLERPLHILPLSARTPSALSALAERWRLAILGGAPVADLCRTAAVGRAHLAQRASVIGSAAGDFVAGLEVIRDAAHSDCADIDAPAAVAPRLAFLFTGQGSHFPAMARELFDTSPVFRRCLERCIGAAPTRLQDDLRAALLDPQSQALSRTAVVQPAVFAMQVALHDLWRSWGISPAAAIGHSLGEYAAACAAGIFKVEDAMRLVVARGAGAEICKGAMVSVAVPESALASAMVRIGGLEIAAYNGPESFAVSGRPDAVAALVQAIETAGGRAKPIDVPFAAHSRWVEPAMPQLAAELRTVSFNPASIALAANATGALASVHEMSSADYWLQQLRNPVRFRDGIVALGSLGITHYIEIGPHPALCTAGMECLPSGPRWLASMRRDQPVWNELLLSLQVLHEDGVRIDWHGFDAGYARCRVDAPTYPFERATYRIEAREPAAASTPPASSREAWVRAGEAAERQSEMVPLGVDVASYPAKWRLLDKIAQALTTTALRRAELPGFNAAASFEAIADAVGVKPEFQSLFRRWLMRLVATGQLLQSGDTFRETESLRDASLDALWNEAELAFADNRELLAYVRHCGELALDVVTGRESPLETLFPKGGFDLAEGLYQRSAMMRYANAIAASAISAFVAEASAVRPLRVIELGAGVGATTSFLLPALGERRCIYHFTDVSGFFIERARTKFADWSNMRYGSFDFDKSLEAQGYRPGQFDIVVSTNAVHALSDLLVTLRRLRSLLAPGGILALIETTTPFMWFDFTTSLIEGWRKHEDDLRTEGPLLVPEEWMRAVREAGFEDAGFWPQPSLPTGQFGQHLIMARVPGELAASAVVDRAPGEASRGATSRVSQSLAPVVSLEEQLAAAPEADRVGILRDVVRREVMHVLRSPANAPPARDSRLMDLGMDSLMALQLRDRLARALALRKALPATLMFDHPTIESLARKLLEIVGGAAVPKRPLERVAPQPTVRLSSVDIAQLSDAAIEELLVARGTKHR